MMIYDIEIMKAIPPTQGDRLPDIEYCAGWADRDSMGISVICAYDYHSAQYRVFLADNFQEFPKLAAAHDIIIGFNSASFDDKVCAANGLSMRTGYDLLREIYCAKGLEPYPAEFTEAYRGYGLNALAAANLASAKTNNGAQAAIDWQRGQHGAVIDYCLNDVRLTKLLFDLVLEGLPLIDPITGEELTLRYPLPPEPQTYRGKIELLLKMGWRQKEIAERIGKHPSSINIICKGKEPKNPNLRRMLDKLFRQAQYQGKCYIL